MNELDVNQYKWKCGTCKTGQDVIEIIIDEHGGYEILFLCGHKEVGITVCDILHLTDDLFIRHKNSSGHCLSRDKTKISVESKRPALDSIKIDRERRLKIHTVWEKNEKGEKELVHYEETPFKKKTKK